MADWLGMMYEVDVVSLDFYRPRVDLTKDMEVALQLPKLKKLYFLGERITPEIISSINPTYSFSEHDEMKNIA